MADNTQGTALVPASERPPDAAALVDNQGAGAVDDDAVENARRAISTGILTIAQAKQHYGLTDAEVAEVSRPAPRPVNALKAVDERLTEIQALRKSDRSKYWSKEVQEEESALYAQRERLRLVPAAARAEAGNVLSPALEAEWSNQPGGIEAAINAIRLRTRVLSDELDETEQDALKTSVDALPAELQDRIAKLLAVDAGKWPKASAEMTTAFAATEWGAELLAEWGDAASVKLGAAKREYDLLFTNASAADQLSLQHQYDRWSVAQRKAVINVLAQRTARRTIVGASGRGPRAGE
jgi:hypothetical protein